MILTDADELRAALRLALEERDEARAALRTVAERQREACAEAVRGLANGKTTGLAPHSVRDVIQLVFAADIAASTPLVTDAESNEVRATPLVTDTKADGGAP